MFSRCTASCCARRAQRAVGRTTWSAAAFEQTYVALCRRALRASFCALQRRDCHGVLLTNRATLIAHSHAYQSSGVKRNKFRRIEYLMHQGKKHLRTLQSSTVRGLK